MEALLWYVVIWSILDIVAGAIYESKQEDNDDSSS